MKKHYAVITSDANRYLLKAAYCQDLELYLVDLSQSNYLTTNYSHQHKRIVYLEEFKTREEAEYRKEQICRYTKMQKEKLIRKKNPNWLGIHTVPIQTKNNRPYLNY